jgi:hypothetical protein
MVRVPRYDGEALEYRLEPIADYDENGFRMSAPVIGQSYAPHKDTRPSRAGKALDRSRTAIAPPEQIQRAKDANAQPFAHFNDGRAWIRSTT